MLQMCRGYLLNDGAKRWLRQPVRHLMAENATLRVLPPDKAKAHAEIHERAVLASRDYSFNYSDPGWEKLKRIITMVRAHTHSLEEVELVKALKAAQAAGSA